MLRGLARKRRIDKTVVFSFPPQSTQRREGDLPMEEVRNTGTRVPQSSGKMIIGNSYGICTKQKSIKMLERFTIFIYYDRRDATRHFKSSNAPNLTTPALEPLVDSTMMFSPNRKHRVI